MQSSIPDARREGRDPCSVLEVLFKPNDRLIQNELQLLFLTAPCSRFQISSLFALSRGPRPTCNQSLSSKPHPVVFENQPINHNLIPICLVFVWNVAKLASQPLCITLCTFDSRLGMSEML